MGAGLPIASALKAAPIEQGRQIVVMQLVLSLFERPFQRGDSPGYGPLPRSL